MRKKEAVKIGIVGWNGRNLNQDNRGRLMKSVFVVSVGVLLLAGSIQAYTIGAKTSKLKPAQTVYKCRKTDENIVIDGKLDENIWRQTPSMKFYGITDGSKPPFLTEGKIIWDDNYLYVGYYLERHDIRCYWTMKDANLSEKVREAVWKSTTGPWAYRECLVMKLDSFVKVFLDPDGDGSNYLEFQINPGNNFFDAWYKQGFSNDKPRNRDRFPHVEWTYPGLLTATHIDGTLNAPHDVDKGWSVEIAIPWKAFKPFTRGACPPKHGDLWGGHFGRVYRDRIGSNNQYWVWPFLEIKDCHLPDRYGKVIFEDNLPKFERFFAFSSRPNEEFIKKAANIGVTDICGKPSDKVITLCNKYKINFYPLVTINPRVWKSHFPDKKVPLQKMTARQEASKEFLRGNIKPKFEHEYPNTPDQPENWQVSEKQKMLIDKLEKTNRTLQKAYQWGGEPQRTQFSRTFNKEILTYDLLCFHNPQVLEALKAKIKKDSALPGIAGIAFDGIGYQNYHDCHCPASIKLYKEYCAKNKIKASAKAWKDFSLKTLVDFNNTLVDYVHQLNPKAKTFNHIWPVYLPEPLYGNRLKMDYCGQTAAWYFYWDPLRIEQYSKKITGDQKKYWANANGVAFIGYYDAMKHNQQFPYKSPAKVESELRAILKGGSRMLMVCGLEDLLENPDAADVFKKFMKKR